MENLEPTGRVGIQEVIARAKEKRMVGKLALSMGLTRQALYLWGNEDGLEERGAVLRLIEISRLEDPQVTELVDFSKDWLKTMEGNSHVKELLELAKFLLRTTGDNKTPEKLS